MRAALAVARALGCGLAVACVSPHVAAAQDGAIDGRVRDSTSGVYLSDVSLTVEEARRGTVTDSSGNFRIRQVRIPGKIAEEDPAGIIRTIKLSAYDQPVKIEAPPGVS